MLTSAPGASPGARCCADRFTLGTTTEGHDLPSWHTDSRLAGEETGAGRRGRSARPGVAACPPPIRRLRSPGAGAAAPGLGGRGCSGPAPRGRGRVRGPRRASQKSTGKLSSAFIFLNVTSFTMEMRVLIFRTHVSSVGSGCLLLILENEQHTEKKTEAGMAWRAGGTWKTAEASEPRAATVNESLRVAASSGSQATARLVLYSPF